MDQKNETYDLKTKQRFQQSHSGRVFPGIVSEVTQGTARYQLSGLLVVMHCLLCMHISGKSVGVKQKVAEKYNQIIPHCKADQRSINRLRISCLRFENLDIKSACSTPSTDYIKKLAFATSKMRWSRTGTWRGDRRFSQEILQLGKIIFNDNDASVKVEIT